MRIQRQWISLGENVFASPNITKNVFWRHLNKILFRFFPSLSNERRFKPLSFPFCNEKLFMLQTEPHYSIHNMNFVWGRVEFLSELIFSYFLRFILFTLDSMKFIKRTRVFFFLPQSNDIFEEKIKIFFRNFREMWKISRCFL